MGPALIAGWASGGAARPASARFASVLRGWPLASEVGRACFLLSGQTLWACPPPLQMAQLERESGAAVEASEALQLQRANATATLETLKVQSPAGWAAAAACGVMGHAVQPAVASGSCQRKVPAEKLL